MNGFDAKKSQWVTYVVIAVLVVSIGCKQQPSQPQVSSSDSIQPAQVSQSPELDARTILLQMRETYANATSYQDKAVLYLDYRMNGQHIQEPQPWATTWDSSGRLSTKLYNAQLRGDGELFSCYVFDIETANLDNQHLLIPYDSELPIRQLFRDSIARHYVGGYSELPLDETDQVSVPKLIPPTLALLTNQIQCDWLQTPEQVERLPDEEIDGHPCFVVRCLANGMTADAWVSQQNLTLMQMSLPLKLLAGEVITSHEIAEVFLMARFHEAKLGEPQDDSLFAIEPRPETTPVRKYVELPPSFPSELIGEIAPQFQLTTHQGKIRTKLFFDGKVTALLWLAGESSYSSIESFAAISKELDENQFRLAAVYSDGELESPGSRSYKPTDSLAKVLNQATLESYCDPELLASTALRVKAIPSVLILDGDSRIQFARALSDDDWVDEVKVALRRIADGDDVAAEMNREYQRFLDSYHQQLVTVSAIDLLDRVGPTTSGTSNVSTQPGSKKTRQMNAELRWSNSEFKQAGNIAICDAEQTGKPSVFVFDGFQTILELDHNGLVTQRHDLNLPNDQAVSQIRTCVINKQAANRFAVFSPMGNRVFLYDTRWNSSGTYPALKDDFGAIRECQLMHVNSENKTDLLVAFDAEEGIHRIDFESKLGTRVATINASSVAQLGNSEVFASQGKIGILNSTVPPQPTEMQFRRVSTMDEETVCAVGVTDQGQWHAVGMDSSLNRTWTLAIGSQFFESQINPITYLKSNQSRLQKSLWAIADTDDAIHIVSANGRWLGDFQSEYRLSGIALAEIQGTPHLLISNDRGVECWKLNLPASPMIPASTGK